MENKISPDSITSKLSELERMSEDSLEQLTPKIENRIRFIPFLNIDTYIIPSPFVGDATLEKDYNHSYVWNQEGEILGYLLVYSNPEIKRYHIFKLVTSPFGRGKGIGSAFINKLVQNIPSDAEVYLYIWKQQSESIDFFLTRGFKKEDQIVYKKLTFILLKAVASNICVVCKEEKIEKSESLEIGKTRHDAKKQLRLLSDMVDMLSTDNSNIIIEDINRETTTLINMLNAYADRYEKKHVVNIKNLIIERVFPFIEGGTVNCEVQLLLKSRISGVILNYVQAGRALINIASNSLESVSKKNGKGRISISLEDEGDSIVLVIEDNGIGIEQERLERGKDSIPFFVGKSTKDNKVGVGIGSLQIFSTFGPDNIKIESNPGEFCRWVISLPKSKAREEQLFSELKMKYEEILNLNSEDNLYNAKRDISGYAWRTTKIEIFCYELIFQFNKYNNIRDINRHILSYWYGDLTEKELRSVLEKYKVEHPEIRQWLFDILKVICSRIEIEKENGQFKMFLGVKLKSYGQGVHNTMIFTMNPVNGSFYATDRKLAEHLDFAPYLGGNREVLLRGEFKGDLNSIDTPVFLGVWTANTVDELSEKIKLIQLGASRLIEIGIKKNKKLAFYKVTYNNTEKEINTYKNTTLESFSELDTAGLQDYIIEADEELKGFAFAD